MREASPVHRPYRDRALHVLIAPDKFKGTLTSRQAGEVISRAVRAVLPDAIIHTAEIADGGEGTLNIAVTAGGELKSSVVRGPTGALIEGRWVLRGQSAIIEVADASGLQLIHPTPATSLGASTFGTGQQIRHALDLGAREIVVAAGGSATTDGGSGAMRALGLRLATADGASLPLGGGYLEHLHSIDSSMLDRRLTDVTVRVAADVRNPLIGAASEFAAQKGATAPEIDVLEHGLKRWAILLRRHTGVDVAELPGMGAAGGFPAGLSAFVGATIERGFDVVASFIGLDAQLERADLVITGEGSLDRQSLQGKAPIALAGRARAAGKPVLAIGGRTILSDDELATAGILDTESLAGIAPNVEEAMAHAHEYLELAAARVLTRWLQRS